MRFTINMEVDNDAFGDQPEVEIARILKYIAEHKLYDVPIHEDVMHEGLLLRDANGNTVGVARFEA